MVRSMHPEVLLLMCRCASICAYHTFSHASNNQITCDFDALVAKPTCPCSTCVFLRSARFDAIFAWGSRSQGQTWQSEERFLPKRLRKAWPLGRPLGRPLGCPLGRPLRDILWWNRRKSAFSTSPKLLNFHWRVHWDDLLKGHTCQHTLRGTIANEKHTKTDNLQSTAHRFIPSGPLPLQTRKMAKWCPWIATNAGNCHDDLCKDAGQNLNSALEPTIIS